MQVLIVFVIGGCDFREEAGDHLDDISYRHIADDVLGSGIIVHVGEIRRQ